VLQLWRGWLIGCEERATRPAIFKWRQDCAGADSVCRALVSRYSLPLRDVEELLAERGLKADHMTIWRWVQCYGPALEQRLRRHLTIA
jgi:transposase, IS6 family